VDFQNRRHFVKGAGLIGLLAFLQACRLTNFGRDRLVGVSTALPADTSTALPTFTPTATSTPLTAPTETPTGTPPPATPTGTVEQVSPISTPTSEATPIPTPTPYPPGPPSKLGLFLTWADPQAMEFIAIGKPALVKTLEVDPNFVKRIKEVSPTTMVVGRIFLEQHNLDTDQAPFVQEFLGKLLPVATDPVRMQASDAWEA